MGKAEGLPGHPVLWDVDLVALHTVADGIIALSFLVIAASLAWYLSRWTDLVREYRVVGYVFCAFIVAASISHVLDVVGRLYPVQNLAALMTAVAALLSAAAVALVWPLLPSIASSPSPQQMAEVNEKLRREAEAHEATLRELEAAHHSLEDRIAARTRELTLTKARFETALHGAKVYVFSQDKDLRYTWMYAPEGEDAASSVIGRSDAALLSERDEVLTAKREVLRSGTPANREVSAILPDRRGMFALHIDPTFAGDGTVDGIMCAAIDISRIRSLESEQRRLTEELGTALQRYEVALRGSNVTVYTQDRDLRYTTVSSPMLGRAAGEIVGRRDEDIMPAASSAPILAAKRAVLDAGRPADVELSVVEGTTTRWYDTHIEPLRDVGGDIVGLTCAAVDITARKAGEAHLRDLMRELTHRSKNLLAVIQGMARQTARHSGSIESFLEMFGARLQALAASHDLLVQESWYGASLSELVRSQLGHYLDHAGSQVSVEGPSVLLKPEAAQSLGLAIHELATNAAKYGALSGPGGRVSIAWHRVDTGAGGIEISWHEQGGPVVASPKRAGFGTLVIERNLMRSLDAEVSLSFPPEGACCRIVVPAGNLVAR
jgi:two-component sensor histidine kinase